MSGLRLKFSGIIFGLFLFIYNCPGQTIRLWGWVKDAETGEPIPFANIYIQKSSVATITDDSGYYFLETKLKFDSIIASFLGYRAHSEKFDQHPSQQINFNLQRNTAILDEIVILPGENPAHRIIRNIQRRKEFNTQKFRNYQCEIYNKTCISLSNIDDKFRNRKVLRPFKFVFEYIDTNKFTGKTYLPVLISETASKLYHLRNPNFEKEIIKATQISGISDESVNEFIAGINQSLDIYSNYMVFYTEPGFVSPIADAGLLFYRYYLLDSAIRNGHKCYCIAFKPRRKQERTFTGEFWVADTSFAIQSITMFVNREANLNFISDLMVEDEFKPVNDSVWLISKEHIKADLNLVDWKKINGMQGDKVSIYSNYILNSPIPNNVRYKIDRVVFSDSSLKIRDWGQVRPEQLTSREKQVYMMVDSIKNVAAFRTIYDILSTIFDAHYNFGKFKIGPYFSVYSYNKVEGNRFRFGGATTENLSYKYKLSGYMAYGTYDNELKYYGKLIWILNKTPRSSLTTVFMHDISQINIEPGEPLNENIISSIARRNPFTKLQMINCFNSTLETDLLKDLTNLISFNYMRIFPSQFIPIIKASDGKTVPFISTSHLDVGFHLESGQEFYQSKFARGRKKNNNPSFDLVTSYSLKGLLGCSYEYWKLKFSMEQYLQTNPFGFNKYKIEAGKTFGIAPWPLLNIMNGNETYGSNSNAYNMMNYYEFVADEYVSLASEQHLQGMILNYLPLIRKLKLREVLSVKAVAGRLSRKNTEDIFLPSFMQSLDKPYIEAGFGIENIFKFVRFDALWRLTYTRNPDVQIFGIRARLQFML